MSFNFSNTAQTQPTLNFGAGSSQAKPGFGTASTGFSFGATTSSAAPVFGGFGSGTTTTSTTTQPTFGFGSNFGTTTTSTSTPAFGAAGTTGTSFGGFGAAASSAPPSFGFGTTTTSTGFGGFGTGLGTTTTGASTLGGFTGFGTTTTSAPSLFSGVGTATNTGFGGFGAGGFGLNKTPAFGTGTSFGGTLGQLQQQQPQQDPNQAIINSVLNVKIFGDERDTIISKWNLLQASWGVGKGYYSQNQPPIEYTPDNIYCRFKAIAYSAMAGRDNKDGLVTIVFNKKDTDLKAQQPQIQAVVSNILGNKPELKINWEDIKALSDTKSQVDIYIEEKNSIGIVKRIPATDLSNFLSQNAAKQQLANLGVITVFPNVKPDSDQLKEYLEHPPAGMDPRIWKQAQEDNPDSDKYIPIPIVGFNQLKWRLQIQESETALHRAYLGRVVDDIAKLKQKQTASMAQIAEYKRKYSDLQHRVLQILVKQEMSRKVGIALLPEEEQLRIQLENMQAQISVPTQFRGRLTELLAHIRIQRCGQESNTISAAGANRYNIEPAIQDEMKQYLLMEQGGINHLIETINKDLDILQKIKDGMQQISNETR